MKLKLTWKIWLLIIVLILSLISVFGLPPTFLQKGVLITSVEPNSTSFEQGLREGQIIISIDNKKVEHLEDFKEIMQEKFASNETVKVIINTEETEVILFTREAPRITVSEIPNTKLQFGLDLIGGSRAMVQAKEKKLSASEIKNLIDITQNRLNEFGLTDLKVRQVSDLEGNYFMLVEIAGATPQDLETLISQQGKFEAKISNETVFIGGEKDIASVCRDLTCAYVEQCSQSNNGYFCNFRFNVYLTEEAAKRHAEITKDLEVNVTEQGRYLSLPLDLYLDDVLVDSLLIGEGLKGRVTTQVTVSGSATGEIREDAYQAAETEMHKLQTLLITGSLPFKLEIVKLDTISPVLGGEFLRIILIAGLSALGVVAIVIFGRYRKLKASLALLLTSFSEVIIILGIAALISWNLDLPSIAGILIVVGTGIDQQIVILDEARQGAFLSLKQRLKRAFAIIIGAYFTAVVAMLPLLWAGAGLLRGFAFTTILGITTGVLITRPAFSDIVKKIEKE
ncbi:MAG TPA: PDZ domain-containing protein [Bacillota bacterium]|nr:PDZ domain-containing protein [Bacillota bacterium]